MKAADLKLSIMLFKRKLWKANLFTPSPLTGATAADSRPPCSNCIIISQNATSLQCYMPNGVCELLEPRSGLSISYIYDIIISMYPRCNGIKILVDSLGHALRGKKNRGLFFHLCLVYCKDPLEWFNYDTSPRKAVRRGRFYFAALLAEQTPWYCWASCHPRK